MRDCNSCALCCKVLNVEGLAVQGKWCPHCKPGSSKGCCSIYEDRPPVCVGFDCLWRVNATLGDDLKPDKCGLVIEQYPDNFLIISVDKHKANNWQKGAPQRLIKAFVQKGLFAWAVIGKDRHLILPKGMSEYRAMEISKKAWKDFKRSVKA
jgi:hypothetical protein